MKTNTVYKRAFNRCLSLLAHRAPGEWPFSEAELAEALEVSRTTVRAVLATLAANGLVRTSGARRFLLRAPEAADYFPEPQTETVAELVERRFMQWVLQGDCQPGQTINASELARQFGTSTTAIREYLTHFSRFGLLERHPNSGWVFKGVTPAFAAEMSHSNSDMTPMQHEYMMSMETMQKSMHEGGMEKDADVAFAKGMLAHHKAAVDMAKIELKYGKDAEMRKLAEEIIKAQQAEIDQMETWVKKHQK